MDIFQEILRSIFLVETFFLEHFLPWLNSFSATTKTIWIVGYFFSVAVSTVFAVGAEEEIETEIKENRPYIEAYNKVKGVKIKLEKASLLSKALGFLVLWTLLIPFWPLFLGFLLAPKLIDDPK